MATPLRILPTSGHKRGTDQEDRYMTILARLAHDETGASAVEYAIIASLLVITLVAAAGRLGDLVGNSLSNTAATFAETE
jgi:Flp pilus assembly pilin Flp